MISLTHRSIEAVMLDTYDYDMNLDLYRKLPTGTAFLHLG